ncbi:PKD domain-containing protein [Halogranum rubrum]|uniref:PKD/Chitinase domain-containing protein n=1 Tax=Halogranum salarium B-1 TaxID=1210908 RepID=J3JI35_9EURY|nr:PKD domain-containing protein [Halogranum salarium]EJN61529.1 hypothetical protein HSB1_05700 [Halogranum salarium B-1]
MPTGVVAANEPPLSDAGLDQSVQRGSSVLLDGTGSRDPDGRIVEYDWTIITPNGQEITPVNESTARTTFDATHRGRYEVSLTVVDEDGASRTDTMYVTVERGRAPTVQISGPETSTAGTEATYTASFDRGAAPLDRIVWRVDGVPVGTDSLTTGQPTASLSHTFGSTGSHSIVATVYDTDRLNDSSTHRLTTRAISANEPADSTQSASLASRHSPTVTGPRLVTGERPLAATYQLTDAPSSSVRSVAWRTERTAIASGRTVSVEWTPGDHKLYAIVSYSDGSRDVARFADGETSVVADPEPAVAIRDLVTSGRVAGDAVAEDGYGNLQSVRVTLNGQRITRWPRNVVDTGKRLSSERHVSFSKKAEVGSESTISVTATDERGQTTTVSKEVTPTGVPEIVSSGFVNTPVDSYHERIDPDRYLAKHVMRVRLNGADPGMVSVQLETKKKNLVTIVETDRRLEYLGDGGGRVVVVTTRVKADSPGEYPVKFRLKQDDQRISWVDTVLHVESSPPELRLNVTYDGTFNQRNEWGMIIDAGSSFDPDGTELRYIWTEGAESISPDNETAKFRSHENATVTLRDDDSETTSRSHSFHQFFSPQIESIQSESQEPYQPNETVTLEVKTDDYQFTKNSYEADIGIRAKGVDVEVKDWRRVRTRPPNTASDVRQWVGTIEVPAHQLTENPDAVLEVYNEENPRRIKQRKHIPSVTVLTNATSVRYNSNVSNIRYLTKHVQHRQQTVDTVREKNQLILRGYNLTDTEITDTNQVIEERVKVQDAQYRTETEQFRTANRRDVFVHESSEWSAGGSTTFTETVPVTETEWRDERGGSGEFTGDTRQKKIDGADYKRWNQYEYEREVTKTGTREDWDYRTKVVEETRTRMVTHCSFFGCYEYEKEYTVDVRESYRVRVTETYTYTTTETETYWSFRPRRAGHDFTGESRLIKVDPADYTTQYEYRIETTREETYRLYEATREVQTAPPQYEWRHDQTVTGRIDSYRITRDPDLRVASTTVSKEWTLSKYQGLSKVISDTYKEEENVLETRATVEGVVVERAFNPKNGTFVTTNVNRFTETQTRDGVSTSDDFLSQTRPEVVCNVQNRGQPSCGGGYR